MQKKLTVGELKIALEGLPEDLVIEFSADKESAVNERILEYTKRLHSKEGEGT